MPLQLEVVTPQGRVFEKAADTVVLPGHLGELGVLPGHIPLAVQIEAGEMRVTTGGASESFIVGGGFAMIANDTVSVLTNAAVDEESIDETAVEDARQRAEQALADSAGLDPAEVERLEGIVRFSVAQLAKKRKR